MGEYTASPGGLQGRDDARDAFNRGSVQGMWEGFLCLPTMLAGAGLLWKRVPRDVPDHIAQASAKEISADGKGPGSPPAG